MLRIQDPPEESKQEEVRMTLDGLAQEGARQLLMTALLVMCTHPFAKGALTLHLARGEGHKRYFDCNFCNAP